MFTNHIEHLICPKCNNSLTLVTDEKTPKIESGKLTCTSCRAEYPILRGIPRFVSPDHYTQAFGYQWLKHAKTQYDSNSGMPVSERRLQKETGWPEKLTGEKILEVACGSGRFTEQLLKRDALIVSFDASVAVEANYESHGDNPSVLIVQADIYAQPFRDGYFDKSVCLGVLQHTPEPKKTIQYIVNKVRSGGHCVFDMYRKHRWYRQMWNTRFWVRPFVRGMEPEKLYNLCKRYVYFMWPLARIITRLPFGQTINQKMMIPEKMKSGKYRKFSNEQQREWALLDLFDWLNPTYDQPQFIETLHAWLEEAGLRDVQTNIGYNGIEGRGFKK